MGILNSIFATIPIMAYRIAHEEADSVHNYRHTHLIWALQKNPNNLSLKRLLYNDKKEHIGHASKVNDAKHYKTLEQTYLLGHKQNENGEWTYVQPIGIDMGKELDESEINLHDMAIKAILECKRWNDVLMISGNLGAYIHQKNHWAHEVYLGKKADLPCSILSDGSNMKPWQKQVWELIQKHAEMGQNNLDL